MGKVLKFFLAAAICVVALFLAREALAGSDTQIPVISDLLNSIRFDTREKELSIDAEPFYEIEDTALFNENESILENQAVTLSYAGESFTSVSLQTSQVNLTVNMASENILDVETEEVSGYQAYVEDSVLYIIIEGTLSAQSAVQGESILPKAQISLPSEFALNGGSLDLELLAGNVALQNLTADALGLKLNAGVVAVDDLAVRELSVDMSAGSVTGEDLTVTEASSLTMSAGSMQFSGDLSGEIAVEVTAGDMSLSLTQPYEMYDCEITCAVGSVTVAGESYSGLTAAETIRHGGENSLSIDCSVGVVTVEFSAG
ncbi:MAG: DUF4097 family beta strand repeat-containing protein [Lachnospiraceae bacterium]|nr:DUF4097 family beta strand repeat-containing protein [Lachnospiraceae bacterium]